MSRIETLFKKKPNRVLNIYCTAGYPKLDSTIEVMKALQENGADIIELGIPYSDPLADGPVIQASNAKAIANGMTIEKLFEQLQDFRKTIHIPVVLMGYMNPVLQYGFERFCADASRVGIDGLILPDMPVVEFERQYGKVVRDNGLDFVFLVTPETPEERVKKLDGLSSGFLYAVSSSSVTGIDRGFSGLGDFLQRLQGLQLKNPILVGFGIKDKATFEAACSHANGAIIGSAYIRAISGGEFWQSTQGFLSELLGSS